MRRLLIPLAVLAGLVLGSLALWWWATARLAAGFEAWAAAAARSGWTVRSAGVHRAGWPLAAELVVSDLSLAGGAAYIPGGAEWRGERVVLRLSPLRPQELAVRVEGRQQARVAGSPVVPFTAARFNLSIPFDEEPPAVGLDAAKLRFGPPLADMTVGLLTGSFAARPDAAQGEPAFAFTLTTEAVALPPPPAPQAALGGRIASATLTAALDGPLPGGEATDPAALAAAWRQGGGVLQVRHFAMGWGPLGVTGTAAMGLDAALQPDGTANLRVVGYDATLAALAAGGALTPSAAQAVRALLGLMARTPEGGGASEVELPLALHNRLLSVGHIPVGKIPPLVWPAAP